MFWDRGAAAALLTTALLLTGCGGGQSEADQLPPPPTLGASPSAAPGADGAEGETPNPHESSVDEAAAAEAEVEQAVRDYYDAINAAQYEGEIDDLESRSDPSCSCRQLVDLIRAQRDDGEIVGGAWSVEELVVQNVGADSASVLATVTAEDGEVRRPDGTVARVIRNGGTSDTLLALIEEGDRWLVVQATSA